MSVSGRTVKTRISFDGFPRGLFQTTGIDSSRIDRRTLHKAKNVEFDETGGLKMRGGIANRLTPLPSPQSRVFNYRKGSVLAVLESDGVNIRVLESTGFTTIGTFSSGGTRADAVVVNGRAYFVNGSGKMKVVENISGVWNVRDAGLSAPTNAPALSVSGAGTGSTFSLKYGTTLVDDRGFESNVSPTSTVSGVQVGQTITVGWNNAVQPAGFKWRVYGSLQDLGPLFFIKEVAFPTTSTTTDTLNLSRREDLPAPLDHDPPPSGITSLRYWKSRIYGAQVEGRTSHYGFSELNKIDDFGNAPGIEYWPPRNMEDLGIIEPSPVLNFIPVAGGLIIAKARSLFLLERDPLFSAAARPIVEQYGLVHVDGWIVTYGTALMVCEPGLVAHDGFRLREVYRQLPDASANLLQAQRAVGISEVRRGSIFYSIPTRPGKVQKIGYEAPRDLYTEAEITTDISVSSIQDGTLDFNQVTDILAHKSLSSPATVVAGTIADRWQKKVLHSTTPVPSSQDVLNLDWTYADASGTRTKIGSQHGTLDGTLPAAGVSLTSVTGTKVDASAGKLNRTFRLGPQNSTALNDFILSLGPRMYYKLDDPIASTVAVDSSGNGLNGTHTNTQRQQAALTTNSSTFSTRLTNAPNVFITVPAGPLISGFSSGLTLSMFINHAAMPSGSQVEDMIYKRSTLALPNTDFDYRLQLDPEPGGMLLRFDIRTSDGVYHGVSGNILGQGFSMGATHHLWGVWYREGNDSVLACGINDTVVGLITKTISSALTLNNDQTPGSDLSFSSAIDTSRAIVDSRIDEISIYPTGLTLDQIIKIGRMGREAVGSRFYANDGVTAYSAVTVSKTLAGFTSFDTPALNISGQETPGSSKVMVAIRFEDTSPPFALSSWKYFDGVAWQPLTSEPNAAQNNNAMTMAQVNALTDANLRATGGIDVNNPKIQFRFWLSGDTNTEASVDQVLIRYFVAGQAIADAIRITEDIPLTGGSIVPKGRYIWSNGGGYRLDDGTTDAGKEIVAEIQTQQVAPVRGDSDLITVEVDVESEASAAETETEFILDGVPMNVNKPTVLPVDFGRRTYQIGAPKDAFGQRHAVLFRWKEPKIKVHGMSFVVEPRGRSEPL